MRFTLSLSLLLLATACHGADAPTQASGVLDGKKVRFPARTVDEGVKATVALLESCCSISDGTINYTAADVKKALEGDYVRLAFTKPITVTILSDKYEVSELVFTQPLSTGVFWLRCGTRFVRATKYEPRKERRFVAWRNEAIAD